MKGDVDSHVDNWVCSWVCVGTRYAVTLDAPVLVYVCKMDGELKVRLASGLGTGVNQEPGSGGIWLK
jgi:hypothetical protein